MSTPGVPKTYSRHRKKRWHTCLFEEESLAMVLKKLPHIYPCASRPRKIKNNSPFLEFKSSLMAPKTHERVYLMHCWIVVSAYTNSRIQFYTFGKILSSFLSSTLHRSHVRKPWKEPTSVGHQHCVTYMSFMSDLSLSVNSFWEGSPTRQFVKECNPMQYLHCSL